MIGEKAMKKGILFLFTVLFTLAFLPPRHSKVEVTADPKKREDGKVILNFKVIPNEKMMITSEGPWQLTLTNVQGGDLKMVNGEFVSRSFDEKIPGFSVALTAIKTQISFDYILKSFICTTDKKRCYPEIHKGQIRQLAVGK